MLQKFNKATLFQKIVLLDINRVSNCNTRRYYLYQSKINLNTLYQNRIRQDLKMISSVFSILLRFVFVIVILVKFAKGSLI